MTIGLKVDTIENLIYNRKEIMGLPTSEDDRIDFHRFMLDEEYQKEKKIIKTHFVNYKFPHQRQNKYTIP